ncbi:hypothetical protein PR003_g29014 [Phytophthora rubi]|uniref:RxLR effector protein n=1 Tax=Phytophthora rubi TaxID=129364 RepID=A0A6A3HV13_9STRA|nr:hypothetical protein PR001_g28715 [Phytophthora rubi]KAE8974429.1 hypothetical protein PR002_g25913 [Phytophthora rubi]KAE9276614.1 hypothetical protein PR003_g29014 [Phytophthora rubi]
MAKWGSVVVLWMALISSISAGQDPRMLRAAVVVHKTNSPSGSLDQELLSPGRSRLSSTNRTIS